MINTNGDLTEKYHGYRSATICTSSSNEEKKTRRRKRNITRKNCKAFLRAKLCLDRYYEVVEHAPKS